MSEEYERVDDEYERYSDESVEVVSEECEVVDSDVEVVDEDFEVVSEPTPILAPIELWYIAVSEFERISRRINELEEKISFYTTLLKTSGLKYDAYKIKRKIREWSGELAKLKRERMKCRVKIYTNCTMKKPTSCFNCRFEKECLLALRHINKRRERKIRKWFR